MTTAVTRLYRSFRGMNSPSKYCGISYFPTSLGLAGFRPASGAERQTRLCWGGPGRPGRNKLEKGEAAVIQIHIFKETDRDDVIQLALHCQNDGSRPSVGIEDQPDLLEVTEQYLLPGGCFWVAKDNEKLVGSLGFVNAGNGSGILKKFFVYESYRGAPHHLGQKLFAELLAFARQHGFREVFLETPKNTDRAHRFYQKAGFRKIEENELPVKYHTPYQADACDFFLLKLPVCGRHDPSA